MPDDYAIDVIRDWERGQADRGTWLSHCQQIANYLQPNRNDYIVERAPGAKRMQWIFDSTPVWGLEQFKAGLHSRLTSPTLPWLALHLDNERVDKIERVRAWMDAATADLYNIFNSGAFNFAAQSQDIYGDLGAVGQGHMSVAQDGLDGVFFSTRHPKECVIFESESDRVNHLSRRWQWTAAQGYGKWGKLAGEKVCKAIADDKPNEKFWFHHRIKPRLKRDPQRGDAKHMPFESCYVAEADKVVISESGFPEFPHLAPRFSTVSGEVNGRGPGHFNLPDIKMLNELMKLVLKSAQKVVDPPLMLPDDGFIVPVKTTPGSFNYYRAGTKPTDRIAPIETHGQVQLGIDMLQALRQQILKGFYIELMVTPTDPSDPASAGKGVTATFTIKMDNENMLMMSPLLSRLRGEFLDPLVARTFAIRWRQSVARKFGPGSPFPPPPPEIAGHPWHAEYVSPIALAQKSARFDTVKRLMQTQLELKQMDPNTPMVLDAEAIMRIEAEDTNAPIAVLKTRDRMQAEADAAAKMQQQAHEAEMAQQIAGAAQKGAGAVQGIVGAGQQAQDMRQAA